MIKVQKDFDTIPNILSSKPQRGESREGVFLENIQAKAYIDEKNRYKVGSVQKRLNQIYNLKCAYCEKKLLDSSKHIEHYRPKSGGYYWLAYSWDNLLLCCNECNSAKGNRFQVQKVQVNYKNEAFEDIHTLGKEYDKLEEPMIINPEKEDILSHIAFTKQGFIYSKHPRVKHTIFKACNLNRDELLKLRVEVLNDFKNQIDEHFNLYTKYGDITRFMPTIKLFMQETITENKFYAFRYFILHNIKRFFSEKPKQLIIQSLIIKLSQKETQN